jgi:Ser/Thr protein kinase RdoA (MazF antagonist)
MSPILSHVLSHFGLTGAKASPVTSGESFSGAKVWHVEEGGAAYALKCYPPGQTDAARLTEIHRLLRHAIDRGVDVIPRPVTSPCGPTCLEMDGRFWDCVTWRRGHPSLTTDPTRKRLGAAMVMVARLHLAWRDSGAVRQPAPVVTRRLRALEEWGKLFAPAGDDLGADIARRLPALVSVVRGQMAPWSIRPVPLQPTHGDLRPSHILFEGDKVTGLIDHAAVKADNVVTDLARLLGELDLTPEASAAAVANYTSVAPLSADEHELLRVLIRTGPAIQLGQWLAWLVAGRAFADPISARRRVQSLLDRTART